MSKTLDEQLHWILKSNATVNLNRTNQRDFKKAHADYKELVTDIKALITTECRQTRIDDTMWFYDRLIGEDTLEDMKEAVIERLAELERGIE